MIPRWMQIATPFLFGMFAMTTYLVAKAVWIHFTQIQ